MRGPCRSAPWTSGSRRCRRNGCCARRDEARAVQSYELGVARGSDAVQMANHVSWRVEYYHRQGRAKEADQLADAAAEVYRAGGLKTKGDLLFWRGQYAESFEYYRRIEERYDAPSYIFNGWINYRDKVGRKDYDAEMEKRLTWVFPQGIQPATLDSLPAPPKTGVLSGSDSASLQAAGLKPGDIIVGLFGQRVETTVQYFYLLNQRTHDTLNLLVWDGSGYREVTASPPAGRFGVRLANHRSP